MPRLTIAIPLVDGQQVRGGRSLPYLCRMRAREGSSCVAAASFLRVSDHRERQDRAIVNTQIGIVNAKIGHGEHLDRAS